MKYLISKKKCDTLWYMSQNITLTVNSTLVDLMREHYSSFIVNNSGEYIDFQAKVNGVVITAFLSKRDTKKVTFVGKNAEEEAKQWELNAIASTGSEEKVKPVKKGWIFFEDQIGSDEVGVGDFLGPMIVVAAFVSKEDINKLRELGVQDSKKMNDSYIMEIGPQIAKQFKYSKLTLPNEKYNKVLEQGENLNSMKAKMHNRALLNLHKERPNVLNIFIDQFVKEETYYKYLDDPNEEQVKGIIFRTKGESCFPCVALASVIARYAYLLEMKKLSQKYGMEFPFGASQKVTDFAKKFVKKYGEKELDKVAKKNFANYNEVLAK